MSSLWPLVPLSQVLTPYQEYIDAPEARIHPKLSVKLYGKGVVLDTPADGTTLKMKRHQLAKAGQVILSEIWGKKGAIGLVPPEGEGALCTSHFFLFDVLCERINPAYLQAIFTANYLQGQLDSAAHGTTGYAAVRPKTLLAATIPLPPVDEQRRIVARIEELAAKIKEARGLRREATRAISDLIVRATVDALATVQGPQVPLEQLLQEGSQNGLSARPSDTPPGVPILRISAATSRADAIINENDHKYLQINDADVAKYRVEVGDLLACRFNGNLHYVGKFALYQGYSGQEQVYPDKLIRFRVDTNRVQPEFVQAVMNSPYGRAAIEAYCATTAGNIGISAGNLKKVAIPIPKLGEQKLIVGYLNHLQAKVDVVKQLQAETAAELDALLPSVLDKAFSGEL